ncbi:MADS-box transcription factor 23-like isoform X1 [Syzygium oleosum]|uniref:MADS-box transcription factor 23-like isoform X1 n=1 Tax=Syzygium oleosum TaxID=219896 RepID=UPI0024BBDB0E|nr:MADS-box transcription factor 23-like isoform X1 [Syzygium oleosum]
MNPQSSSGAGLHITFAKRRNSLMKKARDLSRLCDAEVGIIIFSCTGQLHEYSSSSMDSVIERYNNLKREAQPELDQPPVDAKVLEEEIANLNRQLQGLQEYHRQLMGEDISGLSVKDIQNLENQLEISLSTIRLQKEQIMTDQINELHRKRNLIHQKNIELQEKVNLIDKENAEFLEKVLIMEGNSSSEVSRYHVSYGINTRDDTDIPIPSPSSRPPRQNRSATPPVTTELALRLPQPGDFTAQDDYS